jgi:calcineurin-like phosphoesterase family protein
MKTFFVSDTFFGRNYTAVDRGFESQESMLDIYVENWNSTVSQDDVVFHLGNFAWDPISAEEAMAFLNGKIAFVPSDYDSYLHQCSLIKLKRHTVLNLQMAYINKNNFLICHWPLLDWPGRSDKVVHIHGGEVPSSVTEEGIRFNVNIHNWKGKPIDSEFLLDIANTM